MATPARDALIEHHLDKSDQNGPFWEYFMNKRKPRSGRRLTTSFCALPHQPDT